MSKIPLAVPAPPDCTIVPMLAFRPRFGIRHRGGDLSMRIVAGFAAACIAAVLIVCNSCARAETSAESAGAEHFLFFSGFDLWRSGGFIHGGLLWSPTKAVEEEG